MESSFYAEIDEKSNFESNKQALIRSIKNQMITMNNNESEVSGLRMIAKGMKNLLLNLDSYPSLVENFETIGSKISQIYQVSNTSKREILRVSNIKRGLIQFFQDLDNIIPKKKIFNFKIPIEHLQKKRGGYIDDFDDQNSSESQNIDDPIFITSSRKSERKRYNLDMKPMLSSSKTNTSRSFRQKSRRIHYNNRYEETPSKEEISRKKPPVPTFSNKQQPYRKLNWAVKSNTKSKSPLITKNGITKLMNDKLKKHDKHVRKSATPVFRKNRIEKKQVVNFKKMSPPVSKRIKKRNAYTNEKEIPNTNKMIKEIQKKRTSKPIIKRERDPKSSVIKIVSPTSHSPREIINKEKSKNQKDPVIDSSTIITSRMEIKTAGKT